MLRKLPYGANYLDLNEMNDLKSSINHKILFRYQTLGESVATKFERACERRFDVRRALACHNGTEALRVSLLATRPAIGDKVYIPAVTFIAVAGAILSCGMIPVLCDVDENFALDPNKIPKDAKRIVVAHMEGSVGPLPSAQYVVEDCAQAMGARHADGTHVGTRSFAGTFSFHHNKVLTSGEGGLVLTHDEEVWELMRRYHDHGSSRIHGQYPKWHAGAFYGENFTTSELVASVQLQQLGHLDHILGDLQNGYDALIGSINPSGKFIVRPRKDGDVKISLRIELETIEARRNLEESLKATGMPFWTLERYFLPEHPILTGRNSIYSDGFPWSLAADHRVNSEVFRSTHDRLLRTICLSISPEIGRDEQCRQAEAYARVLRCL